MLRRILTITIAAASWVLAPAPAAAQSTIELRSSARIGDAGAISLDQIAVLEGPEALALAAAPIVEAAARSSGPATITLDEVRKALDARGRINWGRITLRGSTCTAVPAAAITAAPVSQTARRADPAATESGTVRAAVVARIAQLLHVAEGDLKTAFSPDDDQILNLPTAGRTLEIRQIGGSDRMPLAIAVYENSRTIASRTIRVGVQVRRTVPVITAPQRRGDTVEPGEFTTETRWMGPTAVPASAGQLAGAALQGRLAAGQPVMAQDVIPAAAVAKGEIVSVRCISGSLILTTRGRAVSAAKDGELVQLQALDSKRMFFARMDGRGRATITAGDAIPDAPARMYPASLPVRGGHIPPPALSALENTR